MLYMQVHFGQLCQQVLLTRNASCLLGPWLCPLHPSLNLRAEGQLIKQKGAYLKA